MSTRKISTFLCTAVLVLFAGRAIAQNASGTIVGHVKDQAGAAVVAAQVSVTNLDTHDVRTVSTNEAGDYTVPVLQPGHYQVDVTGKGFKSEKQLRHRPRRRSNRPCRNYANRRVCNRVDYSQLPGSRIGYGLRSCWTGDRKRTN